MCRAQLEEANLVRLCVAPNFLADYNLQIPVVSNKRYFTCTSFKNISIKMSMLFFEIYTGDLGQTGWTKSTLKYVQQVNYDVFLSPGDLSYADARQPLWDSFGRLVEPLASARPWMVTQGNHEIEKIPILVRKPFRAYNARWKMPYQESGSASNLYYSFEVAGEHILMLGSYTDFGTDSDQYKWLQVGN